MDDSLGNRKHHKPEITDDMVDEALVAWYGIDATWNSKAHRTMRAALEAALLAAYQWEYAIEHPGFGPVLMSSEAKAREIVRPDLGDHLMRRRAAGPWVPVGEGAW